MLTQQQRETLDVFRELFGDDTAAQNAGRRLADDMRLNLPDMADAAIGLVVLEIANRLAGISLHLEDEPDAKAAVVQSVVVPITRQYACAALNLLELEWRNS